MTMPAMPMPAQQAGDGGRPWQQLPGGYQPNGGQQQQQQVPQQQLRPAQQMQQAPQLPSQMPQQQNFGPPVPMPQEQGGWSPQIAQQMANQMQPPMQPPMQQQGQFQGNQQPIGYGPQGQPVYAQQQQQQPSLQQPAQAQLQVPPGTDPNARLYGPSVPAEMQGRTMAEMIATYNGMKNVALQTITQAEQRGQPPQQQQPVQQQQQGQPAQQPAPFDWRNPAASMAPIIEQVVQRQIAPVVQLANQAQVAQAEQQVAAEIGQATFAQLRPMLYQQLQGASPEVLGNPNTWRVAARSMIGELALQAARMGQQPQVPGGFQPQQIPQGAQPIPNIGQFFSEQPGQGGTGTQTAPQLSATELQYASMMGQTPEQYYAWKYGKPLPQAAPPQAWGMLVR